MEHFIFRPQTFFFGCVFRIFPVSKQPKNWKLLVFEELGIFGRHRQVGHEKWPPMKRFSGLYAFWQRGKRLRLYFFLDFWAKMTFTISRTLVTHHEVTKLLRARNIICVLEAPTARCVLSGSVLVARNRSGPVRSGPVRISLRSPVREIGRS